MRTIVYVDGFNLYYRALRNSPEYKWVNPLTLAQQVLKPENQITNVNFYTAHISARIDPDGPRRQKAYLEALETIPEINIVYGNFRADKKYAALAPSPNGGKETFKPWPTGVAVNGHQGYLPLASQVAGGTTVFDPWPNVVRIIKTEEKGSDVNLGVHLVRDAFLDQFDVAAVITNDTDLIEPIRIAIQDCGKTVGLLCPCQNIAADLKQVASFKRFIRPQHLQRSQFPDPVARQGKLPVHKPASWVAAAP